MTPERYTRLFDLMTEGAAVLENKGDKDAARDSGEIIGELMGALPVEEMLAMSQGMIEFQPIRGASVPPAFHPDVLAFGGR